MRSDSPAGAVIHALRPGDDTLALVSALKAGQPAAAAQLYDLYGADVNRLVWRFLGADSEHDDVVQQVFLRAIASIGSLRDPAALKGWLVSVTVNTVRTEIRRRRFRRLVQIMPPAEVPEAVSHDDHPARAALAGVYRILDTLPADERLAFVLRYIQGESLEDVAVALDCSLATVKRRLSRAEARFVKLAARDPRLAERLQTSTRWKP